VGGVTTTLKSISLKGKKEGGKGNMEKKKDSWRLMGSETFPEKGNDKL